MKVHIQRKDKRDHKLNRQEYEVEHHFRFRSGRALYDDILPACEVRQAYCLEKHNFVFAAIHKVLLYPKTYRFPPDI